MPVCGRLYRAEAETLIQQAIEIHGRKGPKLSDKKTVITNINDGFDFLYMELKKI